jgi:TonB family protein
MDANDPAIQDPGVRISWLTDWIDTHVTNETVMSEFRTLASTPDRSAALVERARAVGVAECAFATEIWAPTEASAVGGDASALAEPELTTTAELPGTLARESIREVVRRNLNQVRFCYEQALSADVPAPSGQVVVSFIVGESGAVESAEIASSTLGSATVESCIVARVSGWTFSAPSGGRVGVRYPFVFSTE